MSSIRSTVVAILFSSLLVSLAPEVAVQRVVAQEEPENVKRVPKPAQFQPGPLGVQLVQVDSVIRATQARNQFGVTGRGLTAAVLDTGLRTTHVDFQGVPSRVVAQRNFTADNGSNANDASDGQGHGSNVCGIIAANGVNIGIAPGANVVPIKVLDNLGDGSFADIVAGLDWVIANRETFNITVVNMSLGDPGNYNAEDPFPTDALREKVKQLRSNQVAVVVSAGNDFFPHGSQQGMSYPAILPETVSVGSVFDADIGGPVSYVSGAVANTTGIDRICPFSQRLFRDTAPPAGLTSGTDVFAPGAAVRSTGILSDQSFSIAMHGTSQAAPATAGLILLMQEYHLQLTRTSPADTGVLPAVGDLEVWLRRSGVPVEDGDDEDDNVTNTGKVFRRIDAVAALNAITDHFQNELLKEEAAAIPQIKRIKSLRAAQEPQ